MTSMLVALADSHSNPGSMTFPSGDQASPYPSQITVSDEDTEITHLSVTISGINHTYPGDLDILLVGPQRQSTILMSDTLATYDLGNATLTFDDAAGQMPLEGQVFDRFYRPTNYARGSGVSCESTADSFPPPAPSTSYGETLSVFNGTNPNGTWLLYVVDDCSGNNGSITGGWSLDINGAGLDSHPVSILGNRFASPYPSEILVSGEGTVVADVDVTISGIYQRYPNDLDILLVGPQGDSVILMSDVGGNMAPVALTNVTLHFDDSADVPLPTNVGIGSGTYQPTNSSTDLFCPPADNFPWCQQMTRHRYARNCRT